MVGRLRESLSCTGYKIAETRKVERNGTVYTQRTENIGRREPPSVIG